MKAPKIDGARGLEFRRRANGWVAVWCARRDLARCGYPVSTQRLWSGTWPSADDEKYLIGECDRLQDEMLGWARGGDITGGIRCDGTVTGLIECYQRDEDSPFHELRHRSKRTYKWAMLVIEREVGERSLSKLGGRDFIRWFENWSTPVDKGRRIPRAHALVTMLRILFGFGVVMEIGHCSRLKGILSEMEFANGRARVDIVTTSQAVAIRSEAHAQGFPSVALAQAIMTDLMLRQKDVIGEWVPIEEPGLSDVTRKGEKWLYGIAWPEISDLVLTHRLSKSLRGRRAITDPNQGKLKVWNLKLYPMAMEELARQGARTGPLIMDERSGLPYRDRRFAQRWRRIARSAGVPDNVQNRDSRAGAITEGIDALDGNIEAVRHAAGHAQIATTQRYSRAESRQTDKVAEFRAARRTDPKRP